MSQLNSAQQSLHITKLCHNLSKCPPYEIGQSKPFHLPYDVSSPVKSKCSTSILLILPATNEPSKGLKKSLTFLLAGKVPSFTFLIVEEVSTYISFAFRNLNFGISDGNEKHKLDLVAFFSETKRLIILLFMKWHKAFAFQDKIAGMFGPINFITREAFFHTAILALCNTNCVWLVRKHFVTILYKFEENFYFQNKMSKCKCYMEKKLFEIQVDISSLKCRFFRLCI